VTLRPAPRGGRGRGAAWFALVALGLVNLLNYAFRNSFQPLYEPLRQRFGFVDWELGLVGFTYMFAHAAATLPMGWAGDRFDRRRLIAFSLGVASVAAAAGSYASGLVSLAIARALCGLGTAAVVPVANSILGEAFDGPRKAIALAIFNLGLILGGVAGIGLGTVLGYPDTWLAFAVPGVLLVPVVATLPVPPRRVGADVTAGGATAFARDARTLLAIPTLRWVIAAATIMAFAAGGYLGWLLDFLQRDRGMTLQDATKVLQVAIIGGLAGVIVGGRVADVLRRRWRAGRLIAICLGLGMTVPCAFICILAPVGPVLYGGALCTMFFVSWYHGPIAASVDDLATEGRAATAQSLVIFSMHALGTAPGWLVIGIVAGATSLTTAMLVNTGVVAIGVAVMARGARAMGRAGGSGRGGAL
jgi:MFS transporter, Spinster family, sphingosine-1-phosphate transporter